jgi:hypothetical protein
LPLLKLGLNALKEKEELTLIRALRGDLHAWAQPLKILIGIKRVVKNTSLAKTRQCYWM